MRGIRAVTAAAAVFLGSSSAAFAQVACNLTVPNVAFGLYDTLSATPTQVSGTVVVDCYLLATPPSSQQIDYSVTLSTGGSNSYTPRRMTKTTAPVENLNYNLYLNSVNPGSVWGDGTAGTTFPSGKITVNKTPGGNLRSFTLIGQVPAQQTVGDGLYLDAIILRATWN